MDARPIGFFDSGIGGLSVLREVQRLAPTENLLYFADTLWFPYGGRPAAEVRKRSFAITQRLLQGDVKMIVVACNTASAAAIDDLRQAWDSIPFVGMVPGLKPAASSSRSPAKSRYSPRPARSVANSTPAFPTNLAGA